MVFINFFGVVVFVAGFLVSGIILDYKESEKIPSELFSALEGLTAAVEVTAPQNINETRRFSKEQAGKCLDNRRRSSISDFVGFCRVECE